MTKPRLTLVEKTDVASSHFSGSMRPNSQHVDYRHIVECFPTFDQLDLFDLPPRPDLRICIVAMDVVHGRTLHNAVASNRPQTIMDLRYAARFDQYGSDRNTLFRLFKTAGCYYILDSIPWHELSARDFITESSYFPRVHHEIFELGKGDVMMFVPKPHHSNMLASYLNRVLSSKTKLSWRIEQIR